MQGTRGRWAAVWAVLALVVAYGVCVPARASSMKVNCATPLFANPDGTFSGQCTIANSGQIGAANVNLTPVANTGGLTAVPAAAQLDKGESQVITVFGTLTNPKVNGTFNVVVRFVRDKDGKVVETKPMTITVLAAVST